MMIFQHEELASLAAEMFQAAGCQPEEATRVAEHLVGANLVGHDSHGVIRIPSYIDWLRDGKVFANKSIRILSDNDSLAVVDGQFGLGQTIGEEAMRLGIDKSSGQGVSVVALRNSGHLGRIGDWAEMAARAGRISLHFVNTSGAGMLVAPFGGIERRLSANPISVGVPQESEPPIVLDMSACTIAEGKIRVALNRGTTVPDGCLIDSEGRPTNEPRVFYGEPPGAILPIAGHKGSGLSFIIEMLAGALTGGSCTNPENSWRVVNSMLSIFIDPGALASAGDFFPEIQRFIGFVKSSRTVADGGEILIPGEIEQRTRTRRLQQGIELDDVTWGQMCDTCRSLNVEHEFPQPESSATADGKRPLSIPGVSPSGPVAGENTPASSSASPLD